MVLGYPGVQSLDVVGPFEVFASASLLLAADGRDDGYDVSLVSADGQPVLAATGLALVTARLPDPRTSVDTVVLPGGFTHAVAADPRVMDWIRAVAPNARRVVSVCTGAFLAAQAGLLDGCRATTHWAYAETLAREFPAVEVDPEPIFVRDGDLWTSAGVTAGIDLALALVEADHGRETALVVARHLVMFLRRPGSQTQFSVQLAGQVAQRDPLRDLQQWIAEHPDDDLSVPALARRANLSPRQFARTFAAEVGTTPGRYVDQIRLETARRRLADTDDGVDQVARACGYGTAEAMRRAFTRELGVPPADYRKRF